jgi:hypothetical protein
LGGLIGGWIGQQESVTEGLGNIFRDLASTAETLGKLFVTMGTDIGWVVSKLFGLGDDFDFLRALMKMLEAPFYYMKLGMMGVYEMYLRMTLKGKEADKVRQEILMTQFKAIAAEAAYKTAQYLKTDKNATPKSISDAIARYQGDLGRAKKSNNLEDIANAEAMLRVYREKLAQLTTKPGTPGAPKPGTPPAAGAPKPGTPAAAAAEAAATAKNPAAEAAKQTAASIQQISNKATTQIKETTAVKTGIAKTTAAVKELTAKTTSQTSLQASVASIYNLLGSGMLRVQTNMTGMMQTGTTQLLDTRDGALPPVPTVPDMLKNVDWTKWSAGTPLPDLNGDGIPGWTGNLGDAISKEMKMKPPGSGLVIANSSETVIPAAGGYGMKDFMGYLRSGFDRMATIIPLAVKMGVVGSNSYGGYGGNTFGNINVTVNAGATTDPDALASIVALKIGEAVADARAASVFV